MKKIKLLIICSIVLCILFAFSGCNKLSKDTSVESNKTSEVTENTDTPSNTGIRTEFKDIEFSIDDYAIIDSDIDKGDNYRFVSLEYTDGVHIISTSNRNPIEDWNSEFKGIDGKIDTIKKDGVEIHIVSDEEDPEYPIYGIEFNYKDYGYEIATDDPKAKDRILKTLKFN